jgi:hypothetical protein
MSKKKRNKHYKGSAVVKPTIVKVAAVKRNRAHQWWVDHKRIARPALIAAAVAAGIIIVIIGIVDIIW